MGRGYASKMRQKIGWMQPEESMGGASNFWFGWSTGSGRQLQTEIWADHSMFLVLDHLSGSFLSRGIVQSAADRIDRRSRR